MAMNQNLGLLYRTSVLSLNFALSELDCNGLLLLIENYERERRLLFSFNYCS